MKLAELVAREHSRGNAIELLSERRRNRQSSVSGLNALSGEHAHDGAACVSVVVQPRRSNCQIDVSGFELFDHVRQSESGDPQLADGGRKVPLGEMCHAVTEEPLVEIQIGSRERGGCRKKRRHQPQQ